mmetsp:Transcript_104398/g.290868  ORF Transcript_104398/g.290868 Transcript_104398/m.290868 type:complete len:204 (+) Transcript_104398:263-874(+)
MSPSLLSAAASLPSPCGDLGRNITSCTTRSIARKGAMGIRAKGMVSADSQQSSSTPSAEGQHRPSSARAVQSGWAEQTAERSGGVTTSAPQQAPSTCAKMTHACRKFFFRSSLPRLPEHIETAEYPRLCKWPVRIVVGIPRPPRIETALITAKTGARRAQSHLCGTRSSSTDTLHTSTAMMASAATGAKTVAVQTGRQDSAPR